MQTSCGGWSTRPPAGKPQPPYIVSEIYKSPLTKGSSSHVCSSNTSAVHTSASMLFQCGLDACWTARTQVHFRSLSHFTHTKLFLYDYIGGVRYVRTQYMCNNSCTEQNSYIGWRLTKFLGEETDPRCSLPLGATTAPAAVFIHCLFFYMYLQFEGLTWILQGSP